MIAQAQAKVETPALTDVKICLNLMMLQMINAMRIYEQRNALLDNEDIAEAFRSFRQDVFNHVIDEYVPPHSLEEQWDIPALETRLKQDFALDLPLSKWLEKTILSMKMYYVNVF